jgi:hypothetical protein
VDYDLRQPVLNGQLAAKAAPAALEVNFMTALVLGRAVQAAITGRKGCGASTATAITALVPAAWP